MARRNSCDKRQSSRLACWLVFGLAISACQNGAGEPKGPERTTTDACAGLSVTDGARCERVSLYSRRKAFHVFTLDAWTASVSP